MKQFLTFVIFWIMSSCNSKNADTNPTFKQSLDGEAIFKNNCANCHKIDMDFTGPALRKCFSQRSKEWVYLFLTKQDTLKTDSIRKALKNKYQFNCQQFPGMNQQQVYAIYNYCIQGPY